MMTKRKGKTNAGNGADNAVANADLAAENKSIHQKPEGAQASDGDTETEAQGKVPAEVQDISPENTAGPDPPTPQAASGENVTLDPDGNPPSDAAPGGADASDELPGHTAFETALLQLMAGQAQDDGDAEDLDPNVIAAMSAAESLRFPEQIMDLDRWNDEFAAFTELADFFRTFPDSPDDAGIIHLERKRLIVPEAERPGLVLARFRVFRLALDQLDGLDRDAAARAARAEPQPVAGRWREPDGFSVKPESMSPTTGLKAG